MCRIASATDSDRADSEDRAVVERRDGWAAIAVADGVGGYAGGGVAAAMVATAVKGLTADWPVQFLDDRIKWAVELDRLVARTPGAGESTAVVALLTDLGPIGVAVGDSVAWDIGPDELRRLSTGSAPKPWLGSESAIPKQFGRPRQFLGTLLLATDGLVKYAPASAICDVIRTAPFDEIPERLIDLARMPNGGLQDDVAVIVTRWEPSVGGECANVGAQKSPAAESTSVAHSLVSPHDGTD